MFVSPAVGLAALVAILRAFLNRDGNLGNYYVDVTRGITRVLLPLSVVWMLFLTWQGVPSTFSGTKTVMLLEPQTVTVNNQKQTITQQVNQ